MTETRRVEVYPDCEAVVEFDPDLTFECVPDCTWCCHHGVLLYEEDLLELAQRESINASVKEIRDRDFVKREEKDRDEYKDIDDYACYFLRDDGKCALHAEYDWKPTRCSVFPLEAHVENDEIHVSVRDEAHTYCDGLNVSERRVIDHLDAFLPRLLWNLDDPTTKIEL